MKYTRDRPLVNQDETLDQILFGVPVSRSSSAQWPLKVISHLAPAI